MRIDFWYGDKMEDIAGVYVSFYPNNGEYRGNVFNKDGKAIGDFTSSDSVEIEKTFPGIFG